MSDLDGFIYWTYAAQYIGGGDLSYLSCKMKETSFVYSLMRINDLKQLVFVKQTYTTGVYTYAKIIPGVFEG